MPRSSATLRSCSSVGLLTAMARSPCHAARFNRALGCNTDKLSNQTRIGEIARLHFPGDRALLNDENALRKRGDEIEILLDQDHGEPAGGAQPLQGFDDLVDDRRLDAFGGLVQQYQPRIAAQAARDSQQLLLAARQGAAGAIEQRLEAGKL